MNLADLLTVSLQKSPPEIILALPSSTVPLQLAKPRLSKLTQFSNSFLPELLRAADSQFLDGCSILPDGFYLQKGL
jgi:hypothetical protein